MVALGRVAGRRSSQQVHRSGGRRGRSGGAAALIGDPAASRATATPTDVRLSHDQRTKDYMAKRLSEGKTKKEVIRCLKRYIAREVLNALPHEALGLT